MRQLMLQTRRWLPRQRLVVDGPSTSSPSPAITIVCSTKRILNSPFSKHWRALTPNESNTALIAIAPQEGSVCALGEAWLHTNAPQVAGSASSMSMIFAHFTQRNLRSLLLGTIIGIAFIAFNPSYRRCCTMHHDRDFIGGLRSVHFIGLRELLGARLMVAITIIFALLADFLLLPTLLAVVDRRKS